MEIKLRNIGIVRDASIKLDGLTVVTGKNETGKTTVGRALYALLDAVCGLKEKAEADRNQYILDFLSDKSYNSLLLNAISRLSKDKNFDAFAQYPSLVELARPFRMVHFDTLDVEAFAHKLEDELTEFQSLWETDLETALSNPTLNAFLQQFNARRRRRKSEEDEQEAERKANEKAFQIVRYQIAKELQALEKLFREIDGDPELVKYVRVSVNRSLSTEFSEQIQPVNRAVKSSGIALKDSAMSGFEVEIQDNTVVKHTFHDLRIKRVYFVDNPAALEQTERAPIIFQRRLIGYEDKGDMDSFFNPDRVRAHTAQLRAALTRKPSVLKETILDENLSRIREKVNAVVPGTFLFSPRGNDYIMPDGNRLHVSNMAAGSKMFSIMKLLLENGLLDENTVLILDEPEIHLHPQWQNQFAEVIALLVKELHVGVFLTTHSTNFALALDTYMRKYGIEDATNFYHARRMDDGCAEFERVNDNLDVMYADFAKPLLEMDMERDLYDDGEYDEGGDGEE